MYIRTSSPLTPAKMLIAFVHNMATQADCYVIVIMTIIYISDYIQF